MSSLLHSLSSSADSFHHHNRPNDSIRRRELKYSVFNFSEKSIATPELEQSDSFKNLLIKTLDVNDSSSSTKTAAPTEINASLQPPSPLLPSSSKGKIPIFGSEQQGNDQVALSPVLARHEEGEGLVSDHSSGEKKEVLVKTAKQTQQDGRLAMKKRILLSSSTSSFDPVINLHDIPPHAQDSNMRWNDPSHVSLYKTGISVNVKMSDKQVSCYRATWTTSITRAVRYPLAASAQGRLHHPTSQQGAGLQVTQPLTRRVAEMLHPSQCDSSLPLVSRYAGDRPCSSLTTSSS